MKRWIWTLLITVALGLAVGCGSKGGSSGKTPAPATPDPVNPNCVNNTANCPGSEAFFKSVYGDLNFSNFEAFKSLRKKYIGCDPYTPIDIFGWTIGGNAGNLSCDSYNDASIKLTILGNVVSAELYIECSSWTCGGMYYTIPILSGVTLHRINNNTGYEARGTFYNDEYSFKIENQDLNGPIQIKVAARKYNMNNPSNSTYVDLGTVHGLDFN